MSSQTRPARRRINIDRTVDAALQDVWELWTTSDGIESWWGPDGFAVTVRRLEVRPGGELFYAMTAVAPEQIEFLKKAGMPLTTESLVTYTRVLPLKRLDFTQMADFIPGVAPYRVDTSVELEPAANGVRLLLTIDAMHDDQWTRLAVMGWESQLARLAKLLASR